MLHLTLECHHYCLSGLLTIGNFDTICCSRCDVNHVAKWQMLQGLNRLYTIMSLYSSRSKHVHKPGLLILAIWLQHPRRYHLSMGSSWPSSLSLSGGTWDKFALLSQLYFFVPSSHQGAWMQSCSLWPSHGTHTFDLILICFLSETWTTHLVLWLTMLT